MVRKNYKRRAYRGRPQKKKGRLANARKMTGNEPNSLIDKIANGVGTVATIAKTVSGIVSMINVEDKFIDTTLNFDSSAGTPQFGIVLNQIAQGADVNQRNGNKVLDKYLQVNLRMFLDATATALATQTLRIVILIDKKPQIGALTFPLIYGTNVEGLINKNTMGDRIVVLRDMKMVFSGGNNRLYYKKLYIPLSRLHTQYTGSGATAYESGTLYLLGYTDVAGLSPDVHIRGFSRFAYMDN